MLTSNWESTETPLLLQSLGFSNSGVAAEDNRVEYESVLISLDLLNHLCLFICGAIMVNYTQTALKCNMNSHFVLGNGIHRRRHERGLEGNTLSDG